MQGWLLKRTKPSTSNDQSDEQIQNDNNESDERNIARDECKLYVLMKIQNLRVKFI